MIIGLEYGWGAVSDRPMDWAEFRAARLLLAEGKLGWRVREQERDEDEAWAELKRATRGLPG